MKMKLSVTLTRSTVRAVDKLIGKHGNRSAFIEEAVREFALARAREARDRRDIEIINKHADELNAFAEDVAQYKAPTDWTDEEQ